MAVEIDVFSTARRRTKLPYEAWVDGRMLRLEQGVDFFQSPRTAANALLGWARRQDIACVAYPVNDAAMPGRPARFLEVWGDASRTWKQGPPPAVRAKLERAGHRVRGGGPNDAETPSSRRDGRDR